MRTHTRNQSAHYLLEAVKFPWFKRLFMYVVVLFFINTADAILSYFSPVYIESLVHNQLIMGIIIASSSASGLLCDILFGEWLTGKTHRFFLKMSLLVYLSFPLSYLVLPGKPLFLFLPMAIWGVCFELGLFSDFHFIHDALEHPHHSMGWSTLKTFGSVAYMIGPLIASFLMERFIMLAPIVSLILVIIAIGLYLLFYQHSGALKSPSSSRLSQKHSVIHEFNIWRLLLPKLWPIMLFVLLTTIVDSAFWTIGAVFSSQLKTLNPFGGFFMTAYAIPTIFSGFIGTSLAQVIGKKRTAFSGGVLAGLCFILIGLSPNIFFLLAGVFIASFFLGVAVPQMYAAIEDYIERLGHSANALIGLENSTTSVAYIVGPIIAGALAATGGEQKTFMYLGIVLGLASLISLLIVPRKIHLPQQELLHIESPL